MSSVRISPHNRPAMAAGSVGEASKPDAGSDKGSFAVALGAAALFRQASGATLLGAKAADSTDGAVAARKRPGDGKGGSDAAALAAQGSLLVAAGQLPLPPQTAAGLPLHAPVDPGALAYQGQAVEDVATGMVSVANSRSHSSAALTPAVENDARSATVIGGAADGATAGTTPVDAMAGTMELLSNLGPSLLAAPNSGSAPVLPVASAELASMLLPPAVAAQTGAGGDNTGTGNEGRFRFAATATATEGALATAAAALGG